MSEFHSFKKSLFGFNSSDVIQYISSIETEAAKQKYADSETIKSLSAEKENISSKLIEKEEEIKELSLNLVEIKRQLDESNDVIMRLKEQINEQAEISNRIGDIFIDAKSTASNIIETAENDAKEIRDSVISSADFAVNDILSSCDELKELRDDVRETFDSFCKRLLDISAVLDKTKLKVDSAKSKLEINCENEEKSNVVVFENKTAN